MFWSVWVIKIVSFDKKYSHFSFILHEFSRNIPSCSRINCNDFWDQIPFARIPICSRTYCTPKNKNIMGQHVNKKAWIRTEKTWNRYYLDELRQHCLQVHVLECGMRSCEEWDMKWNCWWLTSKLMNLVHFFFAKKSQWSENREKQGYKTRRAREVPLI